MSSVSAFTIVPMFETVNSSYVIDLISCGCYFIEYRYCCM